MISAAFLIINCTVSVTGVAFSEQAYNKSKWQGSGVKLVGFFKHFISSLHSCSYYCYYYYYYMLPNPSKGTQAQLFGLRSSSTLSIL
jgi:hypothetical protein